MGVDRLSSTTDEQGRLQLAHHGPRTSSARSGGLQAVLLGEVDQVRGASLSGETAAAQLLEAWARWGPSASDRLLGPWSALVLDGEQLHGLRDLTGQVPLFLGRDGAGRPVAGTDLLHVLAGTGAGPQVHPVYLAYYLNGGLPPADVTPFRAVAGTVPGHVATWSGGDWHQRQAADWAPAPLRVRTMAAAVDLVEHALDAAVAARTAGRSRVGVALSGGLDSTNVLASISRAVPAGTAVHALAVPFREARGDERSRQQGVAAHLDVPLTWVPVDGAGIVTGRGDDLLSGRRWPPVAGNWFMQDAVAEAADDLGVEVVLDGEDADSAFAGSKAFLPDLLVRGQWRTLARVLDRYASWGERRRSNLRYTVTSLLPPRLDRRVSGPPRSTRVSPLLSEELVRESRLRERLEAAPELQAWAPGRRFAAAQRLAGRPDLVSAVALETSAGAVGRRTDVVHPFQDRRVLEIAMALPHWSLSDERGSKAVLRALAERRFPPHLVAPRKARLDEHWRTAAAGREQPLVQEGLRAAAARPDVFARQEVQRLAAAAARGEELWVAARTAVMALWLLRTEQLATESSQEGPREPGPVA